jgi:hypothetical protein
VTAASNVCNAATSCAGTLGSPGVLSVAENAAFVTTTYLVSDIHVQYTCNLRWVSSGEDAIFTATADCQYVKLVDEIEIRRGAIST